MTKRPADAMMSEKRAPPLELEEARRLLRHIGLEGSAANLTMIGDGVVEPPDLRGDGICSYPIAIANQPQHIVKSVRQRCPDLSPPYNNYLLVLHHRDGDVSGVTRFSW